MANSLILTVENPTELRDDGLYGSGALIRVQSAATEGGAYSDISGTGSDPTVALANDVRSYTANDPNGVASTWYRTRYENAGATRVSDWSDPFQAGDETAGLICSVEDVEQETGDDFDANERESVIDKIRQVTAAIEGYTGRWFIPRPLSGDTTYRFHSSYGRRLHIPVGIRSITTLNIATTNQTESGGSFTATTGYYLDPPEWQRGDWPALFVRFSDTASGRFWDATYGVEITGAFGWERVPADIQGVAIRAVVRRHIGKAGGGAAVAVGPAGTEFLLPDLSGADWATLERYRQIPV
jgi:hypothetical protein